VKGEEFEEDEDNLRSLKDTVKFSFVDDILDVCSGVEKQKFYDYFKIKSNHIMMFAKEEEEVGNDNICTLTGKFNINNSLI
jgi:hypothetical protein